MKRWNGWGDTTLDYPLAATATAYLEQQLGASTTPKDVRLEEVLANVPSSRCNPSPLWSTAPIDRLLCARGQSFPDWVALRFGKIGTFPDAVGFPNHPEAVEALVSHAKANAVALIPYGGGTSVVGHINPLLGEKPVVTVQLSRLTQLLDINQDSLTARFGAGITGAVLEANLRAHGLTLGHFPQSFEYSTLGGWVATRSSGQQSLHYGRIEQLFGGGNLVTPQGPLSIPFFPASAAGMDMREMVMGSEGRLGILTDAIVKISPLPVAESFFAVFFPNWEAGCHAVRYIVQNRIPISMLRLSDALETETNLALAGHPAATSCLKRYLSWRGCRNEKCLLLVGITAPSAQVAKRSRSSVLQVVRQSQGIHLGDGIGSQWEKNRFRSPYLRNTLWRLGYGVDTLETATSWTLVSHMKSAIERAIVHAMQPFHEPVHVMTHLSQVYPQGSSIYTTFVFRLAEGAEENLARWQAVKKAASEAIVEVGGTISHQHGVGLDHRPYLKAEKGEQGLLAMQALCERFDPSGMMNPGKLV